MLVARKKMRSCDAFAALRTWLGGMSDGEQGLRACHERLAAEPEGVERAPIGLRSE